MGAGGERMFHFLFSQRQHIKERSIEGTAAAEREREREREKCQDLKGNQKCESKPNKAEQGVDR